ncbi:MAG TPA: coproporphyrinogen III oxidase, partial [Balneolaceae bacterium]|nr:coproporphyrinogen III oxidase [Balneolaceae bacterium]
SFWWDEDQRSAHRWSNESNLKKFLSGNWDEPFEEEHLNLDALAEERLMLGLRTRAGISREELKSRYQFTFNPRQEQYLQNMEKQGKAVLNERVKLTTGGLKIADAVLLDLVTM